MGDAAKLKADVVNLKERLKRLKKGKATEEILDALDAQIRDQDKAARDLEGKAAVIDAAVFDLKAVNPNAVANADERTPAEIIATGPHRGAGAGAAAATAGCRGADGRRAIKEQAHE